MSGQRTTDGGPGTSNRPALIAASLSVVLALVSGLSACTGGGNNSAVGRGDPGMTNPNPSSISTGSGDAGDPSSSATSTSASGSSGSSAPNAPNAPLCTALAKRMFTLTDTQGQYVGAPVQDQHDTWTTSTPTLDGRLDVLDRYPWLPLTHPGATPTECRSHEQDDGGPKALLFPDTPAIAANLTRQFRDNYTARKPGGQFSVENRNLNWDTGQGFSQVDVIYNDTPSDTTSLTTFTDPASHTTYVVLYRDSDTITDEQNGY